MKNITELHPGNYIFYGLYEFCILTLMFGLVLGDSGPIVGTLQLSYPKNVTHYNRNL